MGTFILVFAILAMLASHHQAFLIHRRRLVRLWPIVGVTLWGILAFFAVYLWYQVPQLINYPWVATQLVQGTLAHSTLELMALMLPIAIMTLLSVVALVILFGFGFNQIEKRYLTILAEHGLLHD